NLTTALARTVAQAPQVRLLSQLRIDGVTREGPGLLPGGIELPVSQEFPSLFVLFASPNLSNLRKLQIRVQNLKPDGVRLIVGSPCLGRLTHLELRDALLGTAGVEAIVESGLLGRLKILDLRECGLGDASAHVLEAADLSNLDLLNLDDNRLSNDA